MFEIDIILIKLYNNTFTTTEVCIKSPAHTLTTTLTLVSESGPIAEDPGITSGSKID